MPASISKTKIKTAKEGDCTIIESSILSMMIAKDIVTASDSSYWLGISYSFIIKELTETI